VEDRGQERKRTTVKGFLAWVNADEGIEPKELEDYRDSDEEEIDGDQNDLEHHNAIEGQLPKTDSGDTDDNGADDESGLSKANELSLVDYEGDDEFDYPDEIIVIDELDPEEQGEIDYADSVPDYQDGVYMTKKDKRRMGRFRVFYLILSAIVAINVIGILLLTVNYLPPFGGVDNPAVNQVYTRYVEDSVEETGALNIVSAVLYSYRSFDTLGEAFVLFTAAIGVIMLLRDPKEITKSKEETT
jgi:hypothetical protein